MLWDRNRTTSLATSTWGSAAHEPPPGYDPRWIENIFARLRLANNRYEREMSASAQFRLTGGREPDLSGVYAEMYGVWDDFCARAGLPAASRPPLPIDWVAAPVRSRHNAVLNATTTSVHLLAQGALPEPPMRNRLNAGLNPTTTSVHLLAHAALPEPRRTHTLQSEPDYLSTSPTESYFSDPSVSTVRTVPPSNTTTPSVMPCDHIVCSTTCLFHSREPPLPQPSPFRAIPPAVFYQATVYVALPNEGRLKLKEWRVDRSGPRPKVIWMVEAPPGVLEHVRKYLPPVVSSILRSPVFADNAVLFAVPRDVFPETLHSSHRKTAHVAFPQPATTQAHQHPQHKDDDNGHRLSWKPEDRFRGAGSKYEDFLPEYLFVSPTARRVFQSDVRDKDLVEAGTFDTDLIWTDRTETRHDKRESWGQDLKVWCGRRIDEGRYSLSFNVTKGSHSNRHVECELRRFILTARPAQRGHADVVYLDFDSGDRDSHSTAATDEIQSGSTSPTGLGRKMRRLSDMFSKSPKGDRSRASRSSFTSQRSLPLVVEEDFFANLRYLAVQFSDVEDLNGRIVEEANDGRFWSSFPPSEWVSLTIRFQLPTASDIFLIRNAKRSPAGLPCCRRTLASPRGTSTSASRQWRATNIYPSRQVERCRRRRARYLRAATGRRRLLSSSGCHIQVTIEV